MSKKKIPSKSKIIEIRNFVYNEVNKIKEDIDNAYPDVSNKVKWLLLGRITNLLVATTYSDILFYSTIKLPDIERESE